MKSGSKCIEEYVLQLDGMERCPECGRIWNDSGEGHFHDCRYYILQDQDDALTDDGAAREAAAILTVLSGLKDERKHQQQKRI